MQTTILLTALFAAATCLPQIRSPRPFASQTMGLPARQSHFLNAAPAAAAFSFEPQEINLGVPSRKPINQNLANQVPLQRSAEPSEDDLYRNEHAMYQFSSNIEDHINDQTQQREETRDGLSVKGSYSYSDGYYKRTVHYIADENGYRVTEMDAMPLDGPHIDLMGTASVSNSAHGTEVKYRVASIPVQGPVGKIVDHE